MYKKIELKLFKQFMAYFGPSGLCLKKHCFLALTLGTWMIFSAWKGWIRYHVTDNVSKFTVNSKKMNKG